MNWQGQIVPMLNSQARSNTKTRLVGALDACLGRVLFRQASKMGINELVALYQQMASAYPQAERIWVVQDHWPVHFHPDVLVALEPQESPFSFNPALNWPEHRERTGCEEMGRLASAHPDCHVAILRLLFSTP